MHLLNVLEGESSRSLLSRLFVRKLNCKPYGYQWGEHAATFFDMVVSVRELTEYYTRARCWRIQGGERAERGQRAQREAKRSARTHTQSGCLVSQRKATNRLGELKLPPNRRRPMSPYSGQASPTVPVPQSAQRQRRRGTHS